MEGLFTILDMAKEGHLKKIFWPSSIAVFECYNPESKHAAIHHNGTVNSLWHFETSRRKVV